MNFRSVKSCKCHVPKKRVQHPRRAIHVHISMTANIFGGDSSTGVAKQMLQSVSTSTFPRGFPKEFSDGKKTEVLKTSLEFSKAINLGAESIFRANTDDL